MSENETNNDSQNKTTLVGALADITVIERAGRADKAVYRDMATRIEGRNRSYGDTLIEEAMQQEACELCGEDGYIIHGRCEDCADDDADSSFEIISPWETK